MKIYTRRGDRGRTDLFGGDRVTKDDIRVQAYGDVDELNSSAGVAAAATQQEDLRRTVQEIQSTLFDLGSILATPDPVHHAKSGLPTVEPEDVENLEALIDRWEGELEPLKTFILPGGSAGAAAFQHARAVCRRAERSAVALDAESAVSEAVLRYLNRLSDLFFVMARVENHRAGIPDIEWIGRAR